MKAAVVVFPGTNCEYDSVYALASVGVDAELVWHRETDLSAFAGIVLPGGFAHGDYLRTGAIARFSPVMSEVERMAAIGIPVLGICNGFQILCEAGLLPGVLLQNAGLRFICKPVHLRVTSTDSVLTRAARMGQVLNLPLNSYEGNYTTDPSTFAEMERNGRVVLRYSDPQGDISEANQPERIARQHGCHHEWGGQRRRFDAASGAGHRAGARIRRWASADGIVRYEHERRSCLTRRPSTWRSG